ncbi:hypothetical protein HS1genome_2251 [Sulfodiicoccus acidiphilus]|uniref:Uncharacterized protein n=1 Tax=Sulfodiicoccus acidiphilus TaxID=1670455 RepID=A0A348B6R0_9CREN|nr:hypothetical protein [Sulfodiicoccus acidiphilus]BBD73862.1 hypothetical protein HS1genome_2251 [Sulfodiicoccus acidiphilus]GGT96255.1 hypothetical protein GCM10007116_12250 [Sulfodiicoccus acidiphilus]
MNRLQELLLDFISRKEGEEVRVSSDEQTLREFSLILKALGQEVEFKKGELRYVKKTRLS